jgi:hypothetical protein
MAIREGRWDCPSCGKVGVMGHEVVCPGCGKPRGKVQFYLPSDAAVVTDASKLAEARAGADWICGFCKAANRAAWEKCEGCGAPRADGQQRVKGDAEDRTQAEMQAREQAAHYAQAAAKLAELQRQHRQHAMRGFLACFGGFGLLVCSGMFSLMFVGRAGGQMGHGGPMIRFGAPHRGAYVTIVGKSAFRKVDVEKQAMVHHDDWCFSKPAGVTEISRTRKEHGSHCAWLEHHRGRDGPVLGLLLDDDLGNGYFDDGGGGSSSSWGSDDSGWSSGGSSSHSCTYVTDYEDWCSWEALEWTVVRSPGASDADVIPEWPIVTLLPGERERGRIESYDATVETSDGETLDWPIDGAHFMSWRKGQNRAATFSFFGGLKAIGEPVD